MELKYAFFLVVGLLVITIWIVWLVVEKPDKGYAFGKKVAPVNELSQNKYFKRKRIFYRVYYWSWFVLALVAMLGSFVLLSRPYKTEVIEDEKYQRDIILCLDISTSVDEVNLKLIRELQKSVTSLQGERFGIVIFNTAPVLLVPLTDDYEFVNQQLEMIRKGLEQRVGGFVPDFSSDEYYYEEYISAGTLVGNEERGSSLISDGLASCVYDFSSLEESRTRVVIFASDNDPQGETFLTLDEAADLCAENHVTVYGVGTREMYDEHATEMKAAMEKTGGKFYREGNSGSFQDIVEEIQKKSQNLVKGHRQYRETEYPETAFIVLLITMIGMTVISRLMKL